MDKRSVGERDAATAPGLIGLFLRNELVTVTAFPGWRSPFPHSENTVTVTNFGGAVFGLWLQGHLQHSVALIGEEVVGGGDVVELVVMAHQHAQVQAL